MRLVLSRRQVSRLRIFGAVLAAAVIGVPLASGAESDVSVPTIVSSTPSSPSDNNNPILNGTADPSAVINLYADDPSCSGAVAGTGLVDAVSGEFHIAVTVPDNSMTIFYATATDATPTTSACSAGFTYVEDSNPPATPSIDSSDPSSPANNNEPTLNGTAEVGSTVKVSTDSKCKPPTTVGTGSADGVGHFHIAVNVVDNTSITFYARATDAADNSSACSDGFAYVEDSTPPAPPIIAPHPNVVGIPTTSFSFDSTDAVRYECHVDADAFSACSSGDSFGPFANGFHTFYVRAFDAAGNVSGTSSFQWTIDTINPVVTLTDKPPSITNQTTASFSFSSNKQDSTFECAGDGGGFADCSSPKLYPGLTDGSHTFAVRATAVTTGPATNYTWTVDTVPPQTTIVSTPPPTSGSASAPFTFTSSEPDSTFVCRLDDGGISPCASPQTYAGLGDGSHTFQVQAVDPAGNADSTPASYSWQIQGVGPETIDHTAPGKVRRLKRTVGYRILKLTWKKPPDADFDHVRVFVSTSPKSLPRTVVYRGKSTKYANKRFKNGLYYRYSVVSYDRADNASRGAQAVVPPSVLLRSPRDGRVVHSPPRLLWSAVAKATFYNVQLYDGSRKVLSAWPNKAKLKLARRWAYAGHSFQLRKGLYHWYVWPAFGPRAKSRYGQLLGQGTFRVR